ncbi:MAG TPA: aminomethyl transferase family protein [Pseudolysinimonas sp.]|nr:aminomethyl transferase family protein [Pseudolysinimonas sp.]
MTLNDQLQAAESPVALLSEPAPNYNTAMPYPKVYTNWVDEQTAWHTSAILFDQSYHMTDLYITGPDRVRLVSDTAVNSFANFGAGMAKQYVPVNEQGYVIGDAILLGLSDDELVIVGNTPCLNWIKYQAKLGNYDVTFVQDNGGFEGPVPKRMYRYEVQGPKALQVIEKAVGKAIDPIKFFRMGTFEIAGHKVTALNHTMAGVPGNDNTGLELFGPYAEGPDVLEALISAGEEFGMLRGGATSYLSSLVESGWIPIPMPPIWGDEPQSKAYRESLPDDSEERWIPIRGSFRSDNIEDYYARPWDLGYERIVKFDHEFIGRAALEASLEKPRRTKVWLEWNREDTQKLLASSLMDGDQGARQIELAANMDTYDEVRADGKLVGFAQIHGWTANLGAWVSLASIDRDAAVDGTEVEITWGDPDGGVGNPFVAPHRQVKIRAVVSVNSPMTKK